MIPCVVQQWGWRVSSWSDWVCGRGRSRADQGVSVENAADGFSRRLAPLAGRAAVVVKAGRGEFNGDLHGFEGAAYLLGSGQEIESHGRAEFADGFAIKLPEVSVVCFAFHKVVCLCASSPRR